MPFSNSKDTLNLELFPVTCVMKSIEVTSGEYDMKFMAQG